MSDLDGAADRAQLDPRFIAGVEMLRRTGLREFQLRYQDDETPVLWMAAGKWRADKRRGQFVQITWEAAAALHPVLAVLRLCERIVDGGHCVHCGKMTGFDADREPDPQLLDEVVCWYQWHEGRQRFVRACAGEG